MKQFKRIEPTDEYIVGGKYKKAIVVKRFQTEDGDIHEFTTWQKENTHSGGVIAVTTDGKVPVFYQFRSGPERWMYEIPGAVLIRTKTFKQQLCVSWRKRPGMSQTRWSC